MSSRPTYCVERLKADHLGDTTGLTEGQVAELIRRQEAAIVAALDRAGYDVSWEDIWTSRVGDIGNTDAAPSRDDQQELEQAVADACGGAMDAWYEAGCPSAWGATTINVAAALGITPSRVRKLAAEMGVGHKFGRDWMFTPEDVATMRARDQKRGPKFRKTQTS